MKISVIVPSLNHAQFLRANLNSIFSQGYRDLEVLVFDGGSNDETISILESYEDKIRFVSKKDNGQADAINQGLRRAGGDILAYLNSDDVYFPHALARVADYFEQHRECSVLYGDAWHLHADGSIMEAYYTESWSYPRLFETCYLCQPAVFWRREVLEWFGVLDPQLQYAMDYDYWLRIGREREFGYLQGAYLAGSRLHQNTKTLKHRVEAHHEILEVVMRHAVKPPYRWLMNLASVTVEANRLERGLEMDDRARRARVVETVLQNAEHYRIPLQAAFLSDLEQLLRP